MFRKLSAGCIQKWVDLERLFLSRFFEEDTEVSIHILLATKQKKRESVKAFVKRFRTMALRCSSGMTQSTLVETCRHNLQTNLLARIGVAECRSWRQLISQGEQAQKIIVRIKAEEQSRHDQPEQSDQAQPSPEQSDQAQPSPEQSDQAQSPQSEGEDTATTEANPLQ